MVLELFGLALIKTAAICIEIANIGLLSGLLYLYIKSYRQIKIGFTVGLILFASVLLIRSILTIALLIIDSDMLTGKQVLIGGFIEFIALAILLKITWDY
ncbi:MULTISPECIES: hypothetical protein [Methanobacterium]|jgi:hypothetical protein|uniref:Uncharacterized protein n=1 Tax=Methanobacterium bryantii TaxID=2161 RepID=A0A2A2H173_METBR|nr:MULTISPECIES: hypothetical protein [Methanobacterium]OEC86610.1 hypothetical protein A9507_10420 [Methanobacterium sp. A39]PAV03132.1 hypothetical protein ASJ80_07635 [Methanobacterium bryantii]